MLCYYANMISEFFNFDCRQSCCQNISDHMFCWTVNECNFSFCEQFFCIMISGFNMFRPVTEFFRFQLWFSSFISIGTLIMLKSLSIFFSQTPSWQVSDNEIHSASVDDTATHDCFLLDQQIALPKNLRMEPLSVSCITCPVGIWKPNQFMCVKFFFISKLQKTAFVLCRYFITRFTSVQSWCVGWFTFRPSIDTLIDIRVSGLELTDKYISEPTALRFASFDSNLFLFFAFLMNSGSIGLLDDLASSTPNSFKILLMYPCCRIRRIPSCPRSISIPN